MALRTPLFQGAAHHYEVQRDIVDRVKDDTLPLTPAEVRDRLTEWNQLIVDTPVARTVLEE
jgi:hypothetical protein